MKSRKYSIRRIEGTRPHFEDAVLYVVTLVDDEEWDDSDDTRAALVTRHGDCGQHLTCGRCQVDDRLYPACGHIGAMQRFLLSEKGSDEG